MFDFWSKDSNSTLTTSYIQDNKHNIKLYPVKSNNIVTTSVNTQFHVPKEYVDYTLGFIISMDIYYDPATHNTTRYNSICGRGNNTGFHSGMYVPGLIAGTNFAGNWRNPGSYSTISKTGLTADWYRFSMVVTTTTAQIKLLNLRTNVELTGNTVAVGTVTNGDNLVFTFLSYGIDGYTGAYGSIGINFSNITISRNGTCLLHIPLSSGADTKVVDICNKTQYTLGFFTSSIGWTKLSDYFHANFYYGYTLYTKSGSPNLYICNGSDGSEIVPTVVPSGYTRISNYGPSRTEYNRCESLFKLDDVSTSTELYNADPDHVLYSTEGISKEFNINDIDVDVGYNRGYLYINKNGVNNLMLYADDKMLNQDVKVLKSIGYKDYIIYDENGSVVYDENDHATLS